MVQVKVISEHYRVLVNPGAGRPRHEGRFELIGPAVESAMRITLDRGISCAVERVTVHEPVAGFLGLGEIGETVTGHVDIPGPRSYNYNPELSRYHPVNGWVTPATIDVEMG